MKIIFIVLFLFPLLFWGQKPKLVVGIVVDQMCYDYLYRFEHHFGKKGFHRFMNQGVNCRNTQYNYVPTFTGPGHASIFTGTTPYNHGIVANEWYDRNSKQGINCVFDAAVQSVGTVNSKYGLASPHFLETMTLTDQLKFTYPSSKVFAISIKDRSAILPGGHLSDGSFWFDYSSGTFITSTYFAKALPEWLQEFNQSKNADTYLKDWTLLHDSSTYSRTLDNSPYEITLKGKNSPTFPYNFTEFGRGNYSQFTYTPFANTLLTDLAIECMQHEELGKGNSPDILCISYSTPDIAGHAFGPYSMEVEDIYARLDKDIENLLKALDQQVGKDNYLVFLTADHAVVPVPQQLKDQNLPGGYFDLAVLMKKLRSESVIKYGVDVCQAEENLNIYLNRPLIDSLHLNLGEIQKDMAQWINAYPEVKVVVSASDLERGLIEDPWMQMILRGYSKERSGDVLFLLKPGYLYVADEAANSHKGTSHGSAFNYDTHVPLLWYGNHLKKRQIFSPISITDIAPTLVHFLNLQRVGSMTGQPIELLLGN